MTGETLYVRLGDWVLLLSGLGLVVVAGTTVWRVRLSRLRANERSSGG